MSSLHIIPSVQTTSIMTNNNNPLNSGPSFKDNRGIQNISSAHILSSSPSEQSNTNTNALKKYEMLKDSPHPTATSPHATNIKTIGLTNLETENKGNPSSCNIHLKTVTPQDVLKTSPILLESDASSKTSSFSASKSMNLDHAKSTITTPPPPVAAPKPFHVFEHVLLLPFSHHKTTKEVAIPSNYLTPKEEAEQQRLDSIEGRKRSLEACRESNKIKSPVSKRYEVKDINTIGRSGRISKKPKLFTDYFMENSKNREHYDKEDEEFQPQHNNESDDDDDDDETFTLEDSIVDSSTPLEGIESNQKQLKSNHRIKYSNDAKGDAYWNKQVEALQKFKKDHGHTRVSQRRSDNKELSQWVKKVREKYKKILKGVDVPTLSQERINQLNEIDFIWVVRTTAFNVNFDQHIAALLEFKRENGHTRVPHVYDKNPKLGRWCHHIKLSYKKLEMGEKPMIKLDPQHIDKLNSIGFQWKIRYVVATNKEDDEDNFDEQLQKLRVFRATHGHCNVSHDIGHDDLACWVSSLKSSYRQINENKSPIVKLSASRISSLNKLRFDWTDESFISNSTQTNGVSIPWNERYKQLCDYKKRYGNCRVPSKYDDDKAFGNWVTFQRGALGAKVVGKKSSLSDDQQKKLETLGLEWTVYKMDVGEDAKKGRAKQKSYKSFDEHLSDLKDFYAKNGHFLVPKELKSLYDWINNIRYNYRHKRGGSLTPERVFYLKNLGFDFEYKNSSIQRKTTKRSSYQKAPIVSPKRRKINADDWVRKLGLGFILEEKHMKQDKQLSMQNWCEGLNLGFDFERLHEVKKRTVVIKRGARKPFQSYIEELRTLKEKHGHMNVTAKENKSLAAWMSNIRMSYKRVQEGKFPLIKLTEERRKSLEAIGFDYRSNIRLKRKNEPKAGNDIIQDPRRENDRLSPTTLGYDQTNEFPKRSSDVPLTLSPKFNKVDEIQTVTNMNDWVKSLGLGFMEVSIEPQNYTQPSMSKWCADLNLGFVFVRRQFSSHVEELKMFIKQYGHINVTAKLNKSLHSWVSNIKTSYKRIQQGKYPLIKLSQERIEALESLGIDWGQRRQSIKMAALDGITYSDQNLTSWCKELGLGFEWCSMHTTIKNPAITQQSIERKKRQETVARKSFDERLADLQYYKQIHGHIDIKHIHRNNRSLGNWCRNIRTSYSRFQKGESLNGIRLTYEKIQKLVSIDFPFTKGTEDDGNKPDVVSHQYNEEEDEQPLRVWV